MAITWITPVEVTPGSASAWTDVDVSAYIPSGATGVMLHCVCTATGHAFGLRKNGSSDNRTEIIYSDVHCWAAIGVDGSRILEAYVASTTELDIYLVGYFENESSFFTNATDKSLGGTGSWTDINIASDTGADTAIAAIFEVRTTDSSYNNFGFRKNGSTDARTSTNAQHRGFGFIVGVDGSEICEGYIGSTVVDFFLVGYIKSGATFNTNATDLSLGSTGAYYDLTALPAGSAGGFIDVNITTATSYYFALRKNGSSEDIYRYCRRHCMGMIECDTSQLIEGKIGNAELDFFLVGYAVQGKVPTFLGPKMNNIFDRTRREV